jgi:hypothetical protein
LHYPIAFIYKGRFLSGNTYVGFKKSGIYQKWIDLELPAIEEAIK